MIRYSLIWAIASVLFVSCKNDKKVSHGAIVLGDSATIITETDPTFLEDYVADIKLAETTTQSSAQQPTEETKPVAKDTTKEIIAPQPTEVVATTQKNTSGLTIDFKEVSVTIPQIEVRSFKNQNARMLNGVSYQLVSGKLQGNQLIFKNATITKVSQRYITTLVASNGGDKMELENMEYTSPWSVLKGKNTFAITHLEPDQLTHKNTSVGNVRNAISRSARANRYSRKELNEWEQLAKKVKDVNRAPISVALQSVMWKIEGKDRNNKPFSKEIRLDYPL